MDQLGGWVEMKDPLVLPAEPDPDPHRDPLAAAVVAETCERGYENATEEGLIDRAGVSEQEFRARFESLDECALDSYERFIADFERHTGSAFNRQDEWPASLRAAAYAAVDWMLQNPALAQFGGAEVLKIPSGLGQVRHEEVLEFCASMIDRGREAATEEVPESASMVAVGSVGQLLTQRLQEGAELNFYDVIPELMYRIVSVYLGEEAARSELSAGRPD